jgi:predicted nucleic acid-binding protein
MPVPEKTGVLILDASAAAKWFINEPDSDRTAELLEQISQGKWQLASPELLRYELTHVFWKRRVVGYSRSQLEHALHELEVLGIQYAPLSTLFPRALEVAYRLEIAIYDAFYVALAQALKGTFATFDVELMKRLRRHSSLSIYSFGRA